MATIRDIADRLGLTASTVSHALNERPGKVGAETRRRIFATAAELGYAPNPAARALVSPGRTGNVGLVSRRFNNALYAAVLEAVAVAVDARGGNLVTCITDRTGAHQGQEHLLHTGTVDGLLAVPGALPGLDAPDSPWMRKPMVFLLSDTPEESRAPSVGFDEPGAVRAVVEHLRAGGHERIIFLQGLGVDGGTSSIGRVRLLLLRAAWAEASGELVTESAGFATAAGGHAAMAAALDSDIPFTAVIAYNDQMAAGALRALRDRGLTCPDDIALIGWNDLDDLPAHLTPALTSVRFSPAALADAALDLLYRQIEAPPAERRALVPPTTHISVPAALIARESTASGKRTER